MSIKSSLSLSFITPIALLLLSTAGAGNAGARMQSDSFTLLEATIPQLHAALAEGRVTSRQLVSMYLARIAAYDQQGPALNAISVINKNAVAEADARDSARRAGAAHGLLYGIPIIVKDNYDTSDMQTTAGSLALKGWVPPDDAYLVQKLRNAGAIIIAKANMDEFAAGTSGAGSLFGQVRNPYALNRNPGGSSAGTAAAIAANFATAGMGTDSCSSIRLPSSNNSLVGIRGTQGLASRSGIVPRALTVDMGGPIARTVTDAAIMLDAIAGYDPSDSQTAASVDHIPESYTDYLKLTALRGARIGMLAGLLDIDQADPEVVGVIRLAVDEMKRQGAEIVDVSIPNLSELLKSDPPMTVEEFKFDLNTYLAARPSAPVRTLQDVLASGKFLPALGSNFRRSQAIQSRDTKYYYELIAKRNVLRQALLKAMADSRLEALLYPTVVRKPALIGQPRQRPGRGQGFGTCGLSANSGLPAITVPAGFTPDELPVGIELLGRAWSEPQLIALAYAYEQATHHRRPPASTPALGDNR